MKIDMDQLKKLREATLAPMKDCKDALVEADGDLTIAAEVLKKKGILKAGKKADRDTKEGLVKFVSDGGITAGIKLLCETDFVAKNENFQDFMDILLKKLIDSNKIIADLESADSPLVEDLTTMVAEFVGKMWENVQLWDIMTTKDNVFAYNHPGNKVAALVFYTGDNTDIAKEVALQVAAMNPEYLSIENVPEDQYKEMRDKFKQEILDSGKPENVIDQILKWKMNKAFSEFVLLEQEYIRDGSKKIKNILPDGFEIKKYIRYSV